ncbi:MAG TPA: hypothetical protein VN026_16435 [Bacteroidia bacterium]|jgi:hypothetical protein|nr:hypothetical protein [Bacteroidia bacterium]
MATGLQLNIFHRLKLIKISVAIGLLLSMLCSYNLWGGQRWFPVCPVFKGFSISPPYDYILLGLEIILIFFLVTVSKPRSVIFLILVLNLVYVLLDQNRLQPWFFIYNSFLAVLLFYNWRIDNINNYNSFFIILQLCFAAIYIYSGLQKFNPGFINDTYPWFIKPLVNFVSERQMTTLYKTGYVIPLIEIFIGFGLLIKPLRFIAIPLVILLHVIILILMGPFGNNYNPVVWPWNLMMIVLAVLLFSGKTNERFFSISHLFKQPVFYLVMMLFWILPAFNLVGKWETYLSFSLYSGNNNNAKIILCDEAYNRLPFYIRHYVHYQGGQYLLYPKEWCLYELKTPLYPEKRVFENVYNYVQVISHSTEQDVKLVYIEKLKLFDSRP